MPQEQANDLIWSTSDLKRDPHAAPDKAARVQRMFAAIAGRYDLNNRLHSLGLDQRWRRRAVQLSQVGETDHVLDVACGTGDLTFAFVRGGARSVKGVDFTAEMLEIAREKIPSKSHAATAPVFQQGDAMNLEFPDQSFDIVSIAFGIRNVSDPARALREFRRVLRVGGRLIVLEFSHPRNAVIRWVNKVYCNGIMPFTASLVARDRSGAYQYLPKSVATFPDSGQFMKLLASCGFANVRAHPLTFGVCTVYVAHV